MSYFPSAREAARALGVPLLLREEPDPRAFRRHDWLGTLAVPAASAARMYALALDERSRLGGAAVGAGGGTLIAAGAIWVTGPWGSLAHLPWGVGLADHLARTRGRAGLVEREPDGPLRTLARAGRRIPIRLPQAEALLGGPVDMVNTDLEGVSILLRCVGEARIDGGTADIAAGDFPLILADGLPEALEGPYPGADCVAGVILVASFRDHSRFELDAVVRRLRETGHRLLGLAAIGPEVSDADEAAALRSERETESALQESAQVRKEAQGARVDAAPAPANAAPPMGAPVAHAGMPRPAESSGTMGQDVFPAAARISLSPPGPTRPLTESALVPSPSPALSPSSVPSSPPVRPPATEPEPRLVEGHPAGSTPEGRSQAMAEALPEIGLETVPEAPPETLLDTTREAAPKARLETGLETELGGLSAQREYRATIPLLSTWDRLTIGRSRQRRRAGGGATVLLMLAVAIGFYWVVLRPRLRPLSWPSIFGGRPVSVSVERADSLGVVARAAADSTVLPAESTRTAPASTTTVAESPRTAPASTTTGAESPRTAPASTTTAAESTGTTAGSAATAAGAERAAMSIGRTPGDERGSRLRQSGPGSGRGPTTDPMIGLPALPAASPEFGRGAGVSDTTVALPGGAEVVPGEQFVIHLTSFKFDAEAEIEVTALRSRGIEARSIQVEIPDRGTWYRIVTGNFATFAEAESVALRLQAEGKIPYAHIAADGGRGQPVPVGTLDRARP